MASNESFARLSTGVVGLDEILHGGLPEGGVYLVEGDAGSGKTTLAMQFLLEGAGRGETCLLVSLSQPSLTLERAAESHGWDITGIHVRGLTPEELFRDENGRQDVFLPEEVELVDFTDRLEEMVRGIEPDRVVVDSLTMLQILSTSDVRYRQELIGMVSYLRDLPTTAMLTLATDGGFDSSDAEASCDGIIRLEARESEYGRKRFRLIVPKLRASTFRGGFHDFNITTGGIRAFPRIVPVDSGTIFPRAHFSSGSAELDELVGGGLAAGTSTLIIGPSGTGKTSLATKYVHAAAQRGDRSVMFLFEEVRETFLQRLAGLNMDLTDAMEDGLVVVEQVEAALVSPGEFAVMVRDAVEDDTAIVVIDSLTGYFQSMPMDPTLMVQIRDLIRYLSLRGVLTILTVSQHGLVGQNVKSPLDVAETVDAALLLRYFEVQGVLRKALSVIKKRYGSHEAEIRELILSHEGLRVGGATRAFSGVLSGIPRYEGDEHELMDAGSGQ